MAAHRRCPAGRRRACRADGRRRLPAAVPRGRRAMTATDGGPALHGADAAPAGADGGSGVTARSRARRLRTVLPLARVEASLLVRSLLVLAGLLAGGAMVWVLFGSVEPLWWRADWEIGGGQLVLGMAVLVAAQLAAGRGERDSMADLYASFPHPLAGVLGALALFITSASTHLA